MNSSFVQFFLAELFFTKLGEVGLQRGVEVGSSNQLNSRALGEQATQPALLEWVGHAGNAESAFLVEESLARLQVPAHAIDDPEPALTDGWKETAPERTMRVAASKSG